MVRGGSVSPCPFTARRAQRRGGKQIASRRDWVSGVYQWVPAPRTPSNLWTWPVNSCSICRRMMEDTNSLIEQRKAKLASLRAKGIDPFKNKFTPAETCAAARKNYAEGREVALAGRITAHRDMGKSMFIDIKDQSGRIQVYAQKQALGDEQFEIFKHLDLGDFIGVRGTMFTTKSGEISVKLAS